MRTLKLILEYDGSGFAGWQYQPGLRTVQGEMERAIRVLTREDVRVFAAGRTDAGVHALGQVASFRTGSAHPADVFYRALNSILPEDVAVLSAEFAADGFHARKDARGKWYRYLIWDCPMPPVLERDRSYWTWHRLNVGAMAEAASLLVGHHDFTSFCAADGETKTKGRDLRRAEVFRDGAGRVVIELGADGFLKQMARVIAGTLVEVGWNKRRPGEVTAILDARSRCRAGFTAPARGLYLVRVEY